MSPRLPNSAQTTPTQTPQRPTSTAASGGPRRASRPARAPRRTGKSARWLPDLAALALLVLVTTGLLGTVAYLAPSRIGFDAGQEPDRVTYRNFYGAEQNEQGPFRWAKPEAAVIIPVDAPARYRVTLTLQDNPAVQPPRAVAVYLNGEPAGSAQLTGVPAPYQFDRPIAPRAWALDGRRTLTVELRAPIYSVSGDPRPLGVILRGISVEPVRPLRPPWAVLLGPNLLLLGATFIALRLLGAGSRGASVALLVALALFGLAFALSPGDAAFLAYLGSTQPVGLAVTLALLLLVPPLALALPRLATGWLPFGARAPLPAGVALALALFLFFRVLFSAAALLSSSVFPEHGPCAWTGATDAGISGTGYQVIGVWHRWDACWYEKIATVGYPRGDFVVAFFPLYPLLMRVAGTLLLGNLILGGLAVSALAYVGAMVGLYRLVDLDFDGDVAVRAALYLSIFPSAFFLFAPFTEALFLCLAVWTLYTARRGWWGWAALTGLLGALARTQGCLLAIPITWEVWRRWRAGERRLAPLLAVAAPLCGLALFTLYTWAVAGITPFQAQEDKWLSTFHAPWTVVALSWAHLRWYGDTLQAVNLGALLLFALLLVVGLRRLPASYSLYVAPQLLLLATRTLSTWLASTSRLVLVLFPIFVTVALLGRRRLFHAVWAVISLWLLGWLLVAYLSDVFVA